MLRYAPSPVGDMHLDNLQIAIVNYLVAQQKNDKFLVRIEDVNVEEMVEGKDTEIMMILEKFALKHDAVFHQSEHLNLYQTLALRLLKEKKAFICQCHNENASCSSSCEELSQEEHTKLKESGEPFVVRIKQEDNIEDFVILKADGKPSYNFACASDDMMSDIDLIIRDEKYLNETAKQQYIKRVLGYKKESEYLHLATINEAPSVKSLFEQGFLPDAILNYLLLLSNPKAPKEVFTLPEAIEWFELESISPLAQRFDLEKLRFINSEHLKLIDDKLLSTLFGFADANIGKLAKVYLKECSTINELEEKVRPIFKPKDFSGEFGKEMKMLSDLIFEAPILKSFDEFQSYLIAKSGLSEDELSKPLQKLLTGRADGAVLSEIYPYIKSYILEVAS